MKKIKKEEGNKKAAEEDYWVRKNNTAKKYDKANAVKKEKNITSQDQP